MAATDFKSAQPIRSEADGADQRVQVKIVDKSNPGTQQATVDTDSNVHVESHGNNPTGADTVQLLSEQGSTAVDGIYNATTNSIPATAQTIVSTRAATVDKTKQNLRQTGVTNGNVTAADIALYDENGAPYSASNPLPVAMVNEEIGTPIHSYQETTAAIAPGASQTIIYTATAIMTLKRIVAAASGRVKIEISTGPSASLVQRWTLFNTESNPNIMLDIPKNFIMAINDTVQIKFTSLEPTSTTAFTGYATVEGMQ